MLNLINLESSSVVNRCDHLKVLKCIFDSIKDNYSSTDDISIKNGLSGDLLFLLYYHRYVGGESIEDLAIRVASEIYIRFKNQEKDLDYFTYYLNGYIGMVTVFEHLNKHQLLDTDVGKVFKSLDYRVYNRLLYKKEFSLDLQEGLAGEGAYMLSRVRKMNGFIMEKELQPVEALICLVDKIAYIFDLGQQKYPYQQFYSDLSLSLILLAKILSMNIYPEITEKILQRMISFIEELFNIENGVFNHWEKINLLYV